MRYLLREDQHPITTDYYYECTQTTNDRFPEVPSHTHNYYEIYMFRSGSVKLSIENKIYEVRRGDIIVIPPFTIHQLLPIEVEKQYDRIYMYITEPCLSSFQFNEHSLLAPINMAKQEGRYHFHIDDESDYDMIYQSMFQVYRSKKSDYYGKEMLNRAHIMQIMTLINKHIELTITNRKVLHVNPIIDIILAYINDHYNEPLSLDLLSNHFFINKYTLTKLFKQHTALTVHNYITLKRVSMAKQRITEGAPPSTVYFEVGFKDYSTFYRSFQRLEQITPKEFARFCKSK